MTRDFFQKMAEIKKCEFQERRLEILEILKDVEHLMIQLLFPSTSNKGNLHIGTGQNKESLGLNAQVTGSDFSTTANSSHSIHNDIQTDTYNRNTIKTGKQKIKDDPPESVTVTNSMTSLFNPKLEITSDLNQFSDDIDQLQTLKKRIMSNKTLLLTIGDLNSGKSTFCNTLLKQQVVEENNEPSKAMFVEILNSKLNNNKQEIHIFKGTSFDEESNPDEITEVSSLQTIYDKGDENIHHLRIFINNKNQLLSNDLFEISLIDTPGLNINSMKTTALLAKERKVDVILFVVNAENHFTQSARDFLVQATREKQYVF